MSTFTTGQLIANRYMIQQSLTSTKNFIRFVVLDTHNNSQRELVTPTGTALLRPDARDHFLTTHKQKLTGPAHFEIDYVGEHAGRPFLIRPIIAGVLERKQQSVDLLYPMAQWLIPAILEAAPQFPDGLHPEDIVLTKDGAPHIQPAGIVNTDKLGQLNLYRSNGSAQEAALYGFGVILFELATGKPPFETKSPSELVRLQKNPPRLSEWLKTVPKELDDLVYQLMNPEPELRTPQNLNSLEIPPKLEVSIVPPRLKPKRQPKQAFKNVPVREQFVVMAPANLPISLKRTAAALGDLNENETLNDNESFPIISTKTKEEAQSHAEMLIEIGIQAQVIEHTSTSFLGSFLGLVLLSGLFSAAGLILFSWMGLGIGMMIGFLILMVGGFVLNKKGKSPLNTQWQRLHRPNRITRPTSMALTEARKGIVLSTVPNLAKIDLLDSLDRLQEICEETDPKSMSVTDQQALIAAAQQLEDTAASYTNNSDNIQASVKQVQRESQFIRHALAKNLE